MRTCWLLVTGCLVLAAALTTQTTAAVAVDCSGRHQPADELTVAQAEA